MSIETLTLNIPGPLYQQLKDRAARSNRSVEAEIVERLASTVAQDDGFPAIGTEGWGRMNQRRAALIRKKNREGLSAEEQAEYERLQGMSGEALEKAFPRPAPLAPDMDLVLSVSQMAENFDSLGAATTQQEPELSVDPDEYPLF